MKKHIQINIISGLFLVALTFLSFISLNACADEVKQSEKKFNENVVLTSTTPYNNFGIDNNAGFTSYYEKVNLHFPKASWDFPPSSWSRSVKIGKYKYVGTVYRQSYKSVSYLEWVGVYTGTLH